jgi:hypothetical protein
MKKTFLISAACVISMAGANASLASGIVSTIVNAPLSATGTVAGTRVGINVYLQTDAAPGAAFMDPNVIGYGIPAGGSLEIEMGGDYERDWDVALSQSAIMLVTGAPQQGLPGKAVGYTVGEESDENTFIITPAGENGIDAATLMSPSPGAKGDPVRQRGIKVLHIGFQQSAFINSGASGTVTVRIKDSSGTVVSQGSESIAFLTNAEPQILPTNFPNKTRNHNWQEVSAGGMLGDMGTLPLTYMLYGKSDGTDRDSHYAYKGGMNGVGILSAGHMGGMNIMVPDAVTRFSDGLLIQDTNGDGKLDPAVDMIVGGVTISAPNGASGHSVSSVAMDGAASLSVPTADIAPKPGKRWGGSMLQASFAAGDVAGKYQITLTMLKVPGDTASGDGASYTYTVIAK